MKTRFPSAEMVIGLIAGGEEAMTVAVEGAEDSYELGQEDLIKLNLTKISIQFNIFKKMLVF